ncbi:hypothetical protein TIFTF001_018126 [Ficus carica]|uniref:Uncharacterized protein n=1 Tax=Ficus carica TaxID=3494 RepID=A0AA88D8Z1_FICCA|nr:hypothetical protein TIFTF001_018126 [Ficus carica]
MLATSSATSGTSEGTRRPCSPHRQTPPHTRSGAPADAATTPLLKYSRQRCELVLCPTHRGGRQFLDDAGEIATWSKPVNPRSCGCRLVLVLDLRIERRRKHNKDAIVLRTAESHGLSNCPRPWVAAVFWNSHFRMAVEAKPSPHRKAT